MANRNTKKLVLPDDKLSARVDKLSEITQDLFILEALKAGMPVRGIRIALKINVNRITAISRHLKSE